MPGIEDFPPVGQREYLAKKPATGNQQAAQSPGSHRRPGLFERLAGKVRGETDSRASDSQAAAQARKSSRSYGDGTVAPAPEAQSAAGLHDFREMAQSPEAPELPVFFNAKRR
jgi:cell division protein FtsZ